MSKPATHHSLRDTFAEAMDEAQGPLEHILALTYEFDDQQLLNLLIGRPLDDNHEPRKTDLQRISAVAPIVIYDSRKTREMALVPHFMELLPVRMPAFSCHHPKAYLIVRADVIHLILGSMNLTRTGMFSNREVFQHFKWRANDTDDLQLLSDFADLIEHGHQAQGSTPLADTVRAVRRRVQLWGPTQGEAKHFLVPSGYGSRSGLETLAQIWRDKLPSIAVDAAFAVSPFFDKGVDGAFATDLREAFGGFPDLRIVTDAASAKGLAKGHFGGATTCTLHLIAEDLADQERARIQQANDGASLDNMIVRRNLHAKVLVLQGQGRALVYLGSANFTRRAWNGANRELGVAWVLDGDPKAFVHRLAEAFGAGAENQHSLLGDVPEDVPDKEDYEDLAAYPDFVQAVDLVAASDDEVQFIIHGADLERLAEYEISWGQEILAFTQGRSDCLQARTVFARLIGGRNLRFVSNTIPEAVHYLPFRHSPELFEQRECLLNETAADWIAFQVGARPQNTLITPGERLPDDDDGDEDVDTDTGVRGGEELRAANAAIRMQDYLHLFAQLESEYRKRAQAILEAPLDLRAERWDATIQRPLTNLVKLLQRERRAGTSTEVQHLFKLGELSLMWNTLPVPPGTPAPIALDASTTGSTPMLQLYFDYCVSSHVH